jgi:hypothetical protein
MKFHTINVNTITYKRIKKLRIEISRNNLDGEIVSMGDVVTYLIDKWEESM